MSAKPTGGKPPRDDRPSRPRGGRDDAGGERRGSPRFGDGPPRGRGGPPRREGGGPPRREGRPPWQRDDRPQGRREDSDERPPRRDYGDRPPRREYDDRPPRRDFDDRPPRREYDDRPPRRDFDDRPPRREPPAEGGRRETYFEPTERPRRPSYRADVAGPEVVPPAEYKPEDLAKTAEKVAAACLEVHRQLGSALDVTTYQRALALEMQSRSMIFEREERVPVAYKGRQIDTRKTDFIVEGCLVEIRSQVALAPEEVARAGNYLKASGYRCTVLVNFGPPKVEVRTITQQAPKEE
ncbi:MAG: GxxExxY protein [Chloroflexi bacterium]|nr:GxxExxY protein [Chloroflexota bacterium]MCL5110284.1 GxxExxY protein [Chloroflexota bacterium]